jgi:hypothetical protein
VNGKDGGEGEGVGARHRKEIPASAPQAHNLSVVEPFIFLDISPALFRYAVHVHAVHSLKREGRWFGAQFRLDFFGARTCFWPDTF